MREGLGYLGLQFRMRIKEFLRTQYGGGGAIAGGTALKFCHELVLDWGCEDLFQSVDIVELGIRVVNTKTISIII